MKFSFLFLNKIEFRLVLKQKDNFNHNYILIKSRMNQVKEFFLGVGNGSRVARTVSQEVPLRTENAVKTIPCPQKNVPHKNLGHNSLPMVN